MSASESAGRLSWTTVATHRSNSAALGEDMTNSVGASRPYNLACRSMISRARATACRCSGCAGSIALVHTPLSSRSSRFPAMVRIFFLLSSSWSSFSSASSTATIARSALG